MLHFISQYFAALVLLFASIVGFLFEKFEILQKKRTTAVLLFFAVLTGLFAFISAKSDSDQKDRIEKNTDTTTQLGKDNIKLSNNIQTLSDEIKKITLQTQRLGSQNNNLVKTTNVLNEKIVDLVSEVNGYTQENGSYCFLNLYPSYHKEGFGDFVLFSKGRYPIRFVNVSIFDITVWDSLVKNVYFDANSFLSQPLYNFDLTNINTHIGVPEVERKYNKTKIPDSTFYGYSHVGIGHYYPLDTLRGLNLIIVFTTMNDAWVENYVMYFNPRIGMWQEAIMVKDNGVTLFKQIDELIPESYLKDFK